jgi:hypothetical protein
MRISITLNNLITNKKHINCICDFSKYCFIKLKCKLDLPIELLKKQNNHGISTAGYDPIDHKIYVRAENRALVDICRSIAHEMVHAKQKENGQLNKPNIPNIGGPIEDDANSIAGRLVKMFVRDKNAQWIYKD